MILIHDKRFNKIITALKRSLGQDSIFRSVCQSFCPRGGGVCMARGVHAGEMAIEAGATHPTGIHSCYLCYPETFLKFK